MNNRAQIIPFQPYYSRTQLTGWKGGRREKRMTSSKVNSLCNNLIVFIVALLEDLKNQIRDTLSWSISAWSITVDSNWMTHNQSIAMCNLSWNCQWCLYIVIYALGLSIMKSSLEILKQMYSLMQAYLSNIFWDTGKRCPMQLELFFHDTCPESLGKWLNETMMFN